jgi:hypothetical protein
MSKVEPGPIVLRYWPVLGRALSIMLMLEDAGVPYEFSPHDGTPPHATVVAVPALMMDGEWLSQTLCIMQALGEKLNYEKPKRGHRHRLSQTLNNIYDIQVKRSFSFL